MIFNILYALHSLLETVAFVLIFPKGAYPSESKGEKLVSPTFPGAKALCDSWDQVTEDKLVDAIGNEGFHANARDEFGNTLLLVCLLYTSPSPRDKRQSRMPSSA